MGTSIRQLVFDIGGGVPKKRKFKAIQIGGPSGGVLPASLLDMPMDYETLVEAGSMMGTGGVVVMDDRTCVVDVARYFLQFLSDESCGKCPPCRVGTGAMLYLLERVVGGNGPVGGAELGAGLEIGRDGGGGLGGRQAVEVGGLGRKGFDQFGFFAG